MIMYLKALVNSDLLFRILSYRRKDVKRDIFDEYMKQKSFAGCDFDIYRKKTRKEEI